MNFQYLQSLKIYYYYYFVNLNVYIHYISWHLSKNSDAVKYFLLFFMQKLAIIHFNMQQCFIPTTLHANFWLFEIVLICVFSLHTFCFLNIYAYEMVKNFVFVYFTNILYINLLCNTFQHTWKNVHDFGLPLCLSFF